MGDSSAKKLDFQASNKENAPFDPPVYDDVDLQKSTIDALKEDSKPKVAPTIKEEEADEPLLQENPHRFVLFPIKYHEVRIIDETRYA